MDFRKFLNLFESLDQLNEDLGALANLNAGNLLNVFKQSSWHGGSSDNPKFKAALGQNSEQIDLGVIKSWKDLRKMIGPENPKRIIGAVFYANGTAFAAMNFAEGEDINLRKPTSSAIFAFDPSKLPAREEPTPPEGLDKWELQRWQNQQPRVPAATARQRKRWDNQLETYTGQSVELRDLAEYLDNVIALYPTTEFKVIGLTVDVQGKEKHQQRVAAQSRNDELAQRADSSSWYKGQELQRALDKYKASKNFNVMTQDDEVLSFVGDLNNYGEKFVYKQKEYSYTVRNDQKVSIPLTTLVQNQSFDFSVDLPETAKSSYGSLRVVFRYENGQIQPVKVGY